MVVIDLSLCGKTGYRWILLSAVLAVILMLMLSSSVATADATGSSVSVSVTVVDSLAVGPDGMTSHCAGVIRLKTTDPAVVTYIVLD